jgi:RNA polymerase sigma-70 factor (ECF subfamily)
MTDAGPTGESGESGDESSGDFEALRPRLFGIAYRMTGSVADAEDLCQEAWVRWNALDDQDVRDPEAYLVRTVANLSIDRLRSAQHRREAYVGPSLPEPLVEQIAGAGLPPVGPERAAELADSLTLAFLVLLDELSPVERAVLLLHDVFGYSFDEVAGAVDRGPDACRQIASRTRRKLEHDRDPEDLRRPDLEEQQRLVVRLLGATAAGNVEELMDLLAPDVVHLSDGGANRHAARRPVVGPYRVSRLLVNLTKRIGSGTEIQVVRVNGEAGILMRRDGRPDLVLSFSFDAEGRLYRMFAQLNPDKLGHLS